MPGKDERGNIIPFPGNSAELESAAFWIVRIHKGLSDEERAALGAWLQESAENPRLLFELAEFWDELDQLSELASLFPVDIAPAASRQRLSGRRRASWAVAACLLLSVCLVAMFVYLTEPRSPSMLAGNVDFEQILATMVGEQSTAALPDGSSVILNTDSELNVRYLDDARTIDLQQGEAFFSVADDPDRPFNVVVGENIVRAIGTAFNVRRTPEGDIEVTVTDGVVQVLHDDSGDEGGSAGSAVRASLNQGQMAVLNQAGAMVDDIRNLELIDLEVKLAWQRGMLIFEGEPLDTVLEEFGRYTTTDFILGSRTLADTRVGGYFMAGDIDGLLLALQENFNIRSERIASDRILLLSAQ